MYLSKELLSMGLKIYLVLKTRQGSMHITWNSVLQPSTDSLFHSFIRSNKKYPTWLLMSVADGYHIVLAFSMTHIHSHSDYSHFVSDGQVLLCYYILLPSQLLLLLTCF